MDSDVQVSETGTAATFGLNLWSQPESDVVLSIVSDDTGEVTVSPSTLTFTSLNWQVLQTVTLTGLDDYAEDGSQTTTVTVSGVGEFWISEGETLQVVTADDDVTLPSTPSPTATPTPAPGCDASQITNVVVSPSPSYPGSFQLSWNYPDICISASQAGNYWEQRTEYLPLGDGWHRGGGYGSSTGTNLWGYNHPNYWLVNEGGTDQERACHAVNLTIRINSSYRVGTGTTDYVSGPHSGIMSSAPVAVGCPGS